MSDSVHPSSDDPRQEPEPAEGPTLADDDLDPDREEQGRIGYGKWGRLSPIGLALLIVITLGAIYVIDQRNNNDDTDTASSATTTGELQAPRPAPHFALPLMNSDETLTLDELRGKTVVLNFWASWCNPCQKEMPALQAAWEDSGDDVVFVGVGAKNDKQDSAEAFVRKYGITYPIGRDTGGGDALSGRMEKDFGIPGYPATFFITPDGMINQIAFGGLNTGDLSTYIANASD